jgi:thermostable 8-oxoguanine DNA glycosylase
MVGLHDLLSVLAVGHKALVKLSSNDEVLMKYVIQCLIDINPAYAEKIEITERLNDADMVIATGSNNSARYFDYYFRNKKTLIRKNRTSIAVLTGNETKEELQALADDIYLYYGLGCRNVTHVIMPRTMDLHAFYTALDKYMDHVHHHKFYNNYMYHKSILLMNLTKHYDNGFMIFQEKEELSAPLATLNYHYYDNEADIVNYIEKNLDQLQCIVSQHPAVKGALPFGTSQSPALWHYADNIDTLAFLSSK